MKTSLTEESYDVFLGDDRVGFLNRRGNVTRFDFAEGYWENAQRAVLGLHFEDNRSGRHTSMRLPPWFSNLLPEGKLREWIADARKASIEREMELLAQVGHDLPGAIRVFSSKDHTPLPQSDAIDQLEKPPEGSDRLWSFSLAGVGLKFSMLATGDRLTAPAVGENGDWIVKLPDQRHPHVPLNEYAMMFLAKEAGVEVPETRLVHRDELIELPANVWPSNEKLAYAVKRFDRGLNRELIHIEDFAQVRGFYPNEKYNGSFETIAALAYRGTDENALREFARRMALNILIGNGDAHLKNWSLIYKDRRVPNLAPAYDIVSTFLYRPKVEGPEDMGLKFGRSKRFDKVNLEAFASLEQKLKVKANLTDVVMETISRAIAAWPKVEQTLSSDSEMAQRIGEHLKMRVKQFGMK